MMTGEALDGRFGAARYTLMLRDAPAAEIELDPLSRPPVRVLEVADPERLPLPAQYAGDRGAAIWDYFRHRLCPDDRPGALRALEALGRASMFRAAAAQGLRSLNDQFWLRKEGSALEWKDVSFFRNGYSPDVGNIMFGFDVESPDGASPDIMTNGVLPKTWRRTEGRDFLIKAGSAPYFQEPFNEAFASYVASKCCRCASVRYSLVDIAGHRAGICRSFLDDRTMLVTARDICSIWPAPPGMGPYDHFCECAHRAGIKGHREFLDAMLAFDALIGNKDRHLGNFGALFDTVDLKFTGMAPLYDNGSSLWGDCRTDLIAETLDDSSKPFGICHGDQLKEVRHISRAVDMKAVKGLAEALPGFFEGYDPARAEALARKFAGHAEAMAEEFGRMAEKEARRERRGMGPRAPRRKGEER